MTGTRFTYFARLSSAPIFILMAACATAEPFPENPFSVEPCDPYGIMNYPENPPLTQKEIDKAKMLCDDKNSCLAVITNDNFLICSLKRTGG